MVFCGYFSIGEVVIFVIEVILIFKGCFGYNYILLVFRIVFISFILIFLNDIFYGGDYVFLLGF